MPSTYVPLSAVLPSSLIPGGIVDLSSLRFLDDIACLSYEQRGYTGDGQEVPGFDVFVRCKVMADVRIPLPFLDGVAIVLGAGVADDTGIVDARLSARLPDGGAPEIDIRITTTVLSLSFGRELLQPVTVTPASDGQLAVTANPGNIGIALPFDVVVSYRNEAWSFDIEVPAGDTTALAIPTAMIGSTGIVVEAAGVSLNFSGTGSRPTGASANWKGVYLGHVTIYAPSLFNGQLTATGFGIGTGGLYGDLMAEFALSYDASAQAFNGPLSTTLFGMPGGIRSVSLSLVQNLPTTFEVLGGIVLPFFDQPLDVTIGLDGSGGFIAGLAADGGLAELSVPDVLDLSVQSIQFQLADGVGKVALRGTVTPTVGGMAWPTFEVQELSIDSNGHVELLGGWLEFATPLAFEFNGFRAECARVGFGTEPDGTRWIGIDASLQFISSFALGGSVEGCKIRWGNGNVSVEVRGVGIELLIPETLYLKGKVEFIDDGVRKGFKGGMQLTILPTNLAINVQLLIGRNSQSPPFTYAFTFISLQLPVGIPILNTGLALYGGAGLGGYEVGPAKSANESWFEWYMREPTGVSDVDKWTDQRGAFAVGIGVLIGTLSDNGYAFNGRFLLVLVMPGPFIMLDGQATFLKTRGTGEPNLLSLAIWDGNAGTLLFNVDAKYKYTDSGDMIDAKGFAEAFFDFGRPKKWHFYLGMDTPASKRIRASIYSLFEANAYFMLNHSGIRMGAWFGIDRKWKLGPLKVGLEAWVQGSANVSWAPPQFHGNMTLHGDVGLKAFGFKAALSLHSDLTVRVPRPYYVHADFSVSMNLPRPLPDPEARIEMKWEEELAPTPPKPLEILGVEHLKVSEKWVMASSAEDAPVVPLDAKPVASFQRSMRDDTDLAVHALPGGSERVGSYRFRYRLTSVLLERRMSPGEAWVDAKTPAAESLQPGQLWTQWLAAPSTIADSSPQGVPSMTKLMLWSRTPLDYGRETTGTAAEDGFLDENRAWPCGYVWNPIEECVDFETSGLGKMPFVFATGRLTILSLQASIVKWGTDWISVKHAAVLGRALGADAVAGSTASTASDDTTTTVSSGWPTPTTAAAYPPMRLGGMRLVFPAHTAVAYLSFGKGTQGQYRTAGAGAQPLNFVADRIRIDAGDADLAYVDLMGDVVLLRVCWVGRDEWDRTEEGKQASDDVVQNAIDAMTAEAELLQPHRQYRMRVETITERSSNGGDSWEQVATHSDIGYFRTESAPGLAADDADDLEPNENSEHYPSRGPLKDLAPYVRQTIPYDGARPVYRSYDIGIEMNESYVEAMYMLEGTPLVMHVHDSNGQPLTNEAGEPLNLMGQWRPLEPAQLPFVARPSEVAWMKHLGNAGCADPGVVEAVAPPPAEGTWVTHPRLLLEPDALYRVVVGPVRPVAVVPLDPGGFIAFEAGGPAVIELIGSAADDLSLVAGAGSAGKLLVTPYGIVETTLGAADGSARFMIEQFDAARLLDGVMNDVEPSEPDAELVRVYDWSFITSRFATFTHHIHSFGDDCASLHQQRGAPAENLLTAAEQLWLEDLVDTLGANVDGFTVSEWQLKRDEEGQQFDRVFAVLGLEDRPRPDVVTLTLVDDATRSYALLLESPEPIAWERVDLNIRLGNIEITSPVGGGSPLKIIAGGFAATDAAADLVDEFVELMVLTSTSLAGCVIQFEAAGGWQNYYEFANDGVFPGGTVVRVHGGAESEDPDPLPEREHYYLQDADGPATRQFVGDNVRLRLVNASGPVHHERLAYRRQMSSKRFRVLRSRDWTRALFFIQGRSTKVADIAASAAQMSWTFKRNILPEEPILRRMGSDRPEATVMVVQLP